MRNLLSQSKDMSHEYCATVVQLGELTPIEGTDFLATVMVEGREIVVRKDRVKEGDVMIYISNECQLDHLFLHYNNEFQDEELNANYSEVQKHVSQMKADNATEDDIKSYIAANRGYFDKKCRVRMKRIKGVMSMGYLITPDQMSTYNENFLIEHFDWTQHIGEDFDTVDGELFVKAYVPEVKEECRNRVGRHEKQIKKYDRMIPGQFAFHYDTQQLQREIGRLQPETSVALSIKYHGCVDKDTIINTDHGNFTIKEIVDKKLPYKIKAYDVDNNKEIYVDIDQYYMIPNDGEWYEIELEDGRKIIITGNNPVWLPELNCYRRTDELKVGDSVLIS